jgi:hypothetical protein
MVENFIVGIITALFLALVAVARKKIIIPFFIEYLGERIKIYPMWVGEIDFGSGNNHKMKLELVKLGFKIEGHLEFTSGLHTGKKYDLRGRFQSNVLTFHYYPRDRYSTSQGCATFKRLNDGELLEGSFAYYSQSKDYIDTVNCIFTPTKL